MALYQSIVYLLTSKRSGVWYIPPVCFCIRTTSATGWFGVGWLIKKVWPHFEFKLVSVSAFTDLKVTPRNWDFQGLTIIESSIILVLRWIFDANDFHLWLRILVMQLTGNQQTTSAMARGRILKYILWLVIFIRKSSITLKMWPFVFYRHFRQMFTIAFSIAFSSSNGAVHNSLFGSSFLDTTRLTFCSCLGLYAGRWDMAVGGTSKSCSRC